MKKTIIIVFIILIFIITGISIIKFNSPSLKNIPPGEYISQTESPNHDYTVKFYLVNSHSTVDFAIRGELVNNKSGKQKNIYWSYHENTVSSQWINNNTIEINGKTLNIEKDTYDWRLH